MNKYVERGTLMDEKMDHILANTQSLLGLSAEEFDRFAGISSTDALEDRFSVFDASNQIHNY